MGDKQGYEAYAEFEGDTRLSGVHRHWNVQFDDIMSLKIDQVVIEK